jgi:hypothetical protein
VITRAVTGSPQLLESSLVYLTTRALVMIARGRGSTIIQVCRFGLILTGRCGIVARTPPASGASLIPDLPIVSDCPLIACVAASILIRRIHAARLSVYTSLESVLTLIVYAWMTPKLMPTLVDVYRQRCIYSIIGYFVTPCTSALISCRAAVSLLGIAAQLDRLAAFKSRVRGSLCLLLCTTACSR